MQHSLSLARWLAAALLVVAPWTADAAGLGRLTVQSSLGQPFRAEVDLVAVQKEELATLTVRLASPAAYQQAGLVYNSIVAGLSLRIEQRPDGQPYIRVSSERPVNEFVLDVLLDLAWASGRIMREYRVLLDPPGVPTAPAVAESRPAPSAIEAPAPRAIVSERTRAAASGSYGPIRRGETLSQIARSVRPDGVSVEQMLVGLYRSNPEAFIRKNMNLMRSGRILRVPEREEVAAITQQEAVKEYRAQVADWNSYRQSLAQAPAPAPEGGAARSGRISARVEDTTAGEARDVVRLSKGEPPAGAPAAKAEASAKERIRALEEEIVAREKALKEANERVAQLEKTIKDMQRLVELKSAGMASAQQKAEAATKPEPQKVVEGPKPEPQKVAEAPKPEPAKPAPPEQAKVPDTPPATETPKPKPAAKPPVKPVAAPPLPPEPSFVESLLANPLHLGLIGLALLGGAAFWMMRRRRAEGSRASALFAPQAEGAAVPAGAAVAGGVVAAAAAAAQPKEAAAEVDPVEEARIYVMHGRDTQAETILKDAIAKQPKREAAYLSLLEIYATRKDKAAFGKYAADFQKVTGGAGENWLKVAAMGYALDADNPLYAAGKDAVASAPPAGEARSVDLDLDLDLTAGGPATPDVTLDAGNGKPAAARTSSVDMELPAAEGKPAAAPAREDPKPLEFHIELPPAGSVSSTPSATADTAASFKLPDIDLNLDATPPSAAGGGKDAHWYDVQTKFDLAKAYEEMGDKAGARQILGEVIREGDAEQQAQAKSLLARLN